MAEKIEEFLFDIMGLLVPGMIVFFTFGLTLASMINWDPFINSISSMNYNNSILLKLIISNRLLERSSWGNGEVIYVLVGFLIISYLLGHIAKVFSKYFYDFGKVFFDEGFNKIVEYLLTQCKTKLSGKINFGRWPLWLNKLRKWFMYKFSKQVSKVISEYFTFGAANYGYGNKDIAKKVVEFLNNKCQMNFPDNWYSIYKFSKVMMDQEKIKSLSSRFLAKYNFYRSLSFIFFVNNLLILFLLRYKYQILNEGVLQYYHALLIFSLASWMTFHEKYKRYWTLCGNEALMSLFYFFIKNEVKLPNEQAHE
ncbi:hypothetical protein Desor_4363 [Desulfosporosinus orientis DSM 765]|uniref:Uncharacterized protein n=1 Tax=Desulfosporosinus orientis (strain ATCC 19365 / DSM 765 / NCIMB 8382 / VKM B-1628 / Singapore I) TaxID=768706 RepID=G7WJC9_DESOD|nr:hypothetical protein [Desulfosporosinus orientis]AET69788.1 hypothetical protein Desor_4363 [Desulfosporosinus orientis DSM 765]